MTWKAVIGLTAGGYGQARARTSLAARAPERRAPSIKPAQAPAVCSPAKCTLPSGAAMRSSSPSATVTVSAEYDSPVHGSSFQVVSRPRLGSADRSGRRGHRPGRPPGRPIGYAQSGQAFLGTAECMQDRLDLAGPVGRCPGPEPVGHALHG